MSAIVRKKNRDDAPRMLEIARELGEWFNAEGIARMQRELVEHDGLVAFVGDELVGFATFAPKDERVVEMTWLAVTRAHHRNRVGTTLCLALHDEMRRREMQTIEVSTLAETIHYAPYEGTRRFYLALGYRPIRVDHAYWGHGNDRLLLGFDLLNIEKRTP